LLNTLIEPFTYPFMREALLVAVLVGTICAMLSCYLILKGWALMGDAVSHAVFPGVVLAYVLGLPLAVGAFAAGFFCAGATGWIKSNSRVKEDTIMGIVFTGMFAMGLVMYTKIDTNIHLNHILFGSLLGIERSDLIQAVVVSVVVLLVLIVKRRDLMLFCFDQNHARTIGMNTTMLHYLLLAILAATIVAALQAVGIILTVAMLITPGCVAYQLSDRFERMMLIAVASSIFSSVFGVYISYFIDGGTGACIVLTQSALFVIAMFLGPKRGVVWTYLARA